MEDIIRNLKAVSEEPSREYDSTSEARSAAVLVVLCDIDGICHVFLNKRNESLRRHPGEVCFPGGMREEVDRSVVDTAVRECEEETGLKRDMVNVAAVLPSLKVYKKTLPLTPVVCTVPPDTLNTYSFNPNPDEVSDIFHIPLSTFLSDTGPDLLSHTVEHVSPSFDLHHFNVSHASRQFDVRGITAHLCVVIAALALGRAPDFPYALPGEYCVMGEAVRERVLQIMGQ